MRIMQDHATVIRSICCLQVTLSTNPSGNDTLTQTLEAVGLNESAFDITAALHSYFTVSSIDQVCW